MWSSLQQQSHSSNRVMDIATKVFVAGHRGMVGSAIVRQLKGRGDVELFVRSRAELDLGRAAEVEDFLGDHGIDQLYLAAAMVGGIQANNEYPADFIYENLRIQNSVMHAARMVGVHAQTLRYYERIGLVAPARSRGNIRMFSPFDVQRAKWIKSLIDDLGINLAGVDVIIRMTSRMAELERRVQELTTQLKQET